MFTGRINLIRRTQLLCGYSIVDINIDEMVKSTNVY